MRRAALGGVVGPVVFIMTWAMASVMLRGYSMSDDAISELAAVGADTRALMTGGFVAFALCVVPYAVALRQDLGGAAWISAAGTGVATLVVAAIPLGQSTTADHCHGVVAVLGYFSLAVTPLLAVRPLLDRGSRAAASLSIVTAAVSATGLLLSDITPLTGLFQRIGLTAGQIWIASSALAMLAGRSQARWSEHPTESSSSPLVLDQARSSR
jgi:hypothetical membrane protein